MSRVTSTAAEEMMQIAFIEAPVRWRICGWSTNGDKVQHVGLQLVDYIELNGEQWAEFLKSATVVQRQP